MAESTALEARCRCKKAHPLADPTAGGTLCGADTRQVEAKYPTCHRPAGWGTPEPMPGRRCKLHGGSSLVKHGRYATLKRARVVELITEMEQDPDPLNILPELAAARAIFIDWYERYDEWRDALLAWHADWQLQRRPLPPDLLHAFGNVVDEYEVRRRERGEEMTERQLADIAGARKFVDFMRGSEAAVRPREVLDPSAAMGHIDTITKIVERIEKIHAANAISRKDMTRLIDQMGKAVMKHVDDPETLKRIRNEWLSLAVV